MFGMTESKTEAGIEALPKLTTRRVFLKHCAATVGGLTAGSVWPARGAEPARESGGRAKVVSAGRMFHVMPHSHIDVEWYWTFATTREWTAEILNKAVALLMSDSEYRFTQDQVVLVRSYWETLGADERARFKQLVTEGRLAIVGGMLVQPEVAEPSGESLVRQILLGQQWLKANLGIRARCGWFIDTFGQAPQIPQLLRQAGYEANVFWRDIPLEYSVDSMPADFYWEAPDGTRVLTHWLAGGYAFRDTEIQAAASHSRSGQVLVPYGSDVSRPTEDSPAIRRIMEERLAKLELPYSKIRVSAAPEYFDALRAEAASLPVLRLDFNPPQRAQDLRGAYDNRIELKKRNRAAEQALYSAECVAAIAMTGGNPVSQPAAAALRAGEGDSARAPGSRQEALRQLWEKLLFTHFHDIIGGSHSDPVYLSAMDRLESVLEQSRQLTTESLRQVIPGAGQPGEWFAAYNTLSFRRSELCRMRVPCSRLAGKTGLRLQDDERRHIAFRVVKPLGSGRLGAEAAIEFVAVEVPATGYLSYRLVSGAASRPAPRRKVGLNFLENVRYRLEWDSSTGDIVRLHDMRRKRELLAGDSNTVIFAQERNPNLEGNLGLTGREISSSSYPVSSLTPAQDELGLRVTVVNRLPDCVLEREIVLWDQLERIDFRTTLRDFSGGDVLVKVSFAPWLDWSKVQRVYETPFAATPRPEGHFAARTWVDCSDGRFGLALLNRGTPGYWIAEGKLELVLLRSLANYTAYQKSGLRKGVPGYEHSTQTELAREHGTHHFEYALLPHAGPWFSGALPVHGLSYNTALLSLTGLDGAVAQQTGRSFIECSPDFLVTAIKLAEDGPGLVVRGYETRGQAHRVTMRLPRAIRHVQRANLLEEPNETLPFSHDRLAFSCRPHEIVTLLLRC